MKPVVVMTQTSEIQSDLVTIIHKPFIDIKPLEFDLRLLKDNYDWLIFSSKNAVKYFLPYLYLVNYKKIAVVGVKTAQYCRELKIPVDLIPQDYSQEGLISEFQKYNQNILIPSSKQARPLLKETLARNNDVVKIDLYEPVPHYQHINEVKSLIFNQEIDALTFSSSSSVRYYFNEYPIPKFDHYFAIGKQTANTIHSYNQPVIVADKQTLEALIDKVVESRD
ncbi:uroporphyrinogen-III synthase [Staphylococcus warneri]|uniref:uroporphyrinogen-III synthase n=1 Tax=Staphylococcus warneri TaxID=1292 RepID=UPI001FB2A79A|nr:uroporphyrinogen-III synthase [Staphylococcus warneri]MCJ1785818.1 uroporphyrinogen-III synthase [Staphylococcus warneri]MCJ1789248.1 uroporphyrinogen-III synthase [Staphylococcus warneri]MCJ1791676.1 uroporphyrinogen-III synthase [Staphylococcus warneri]MCJ1794135.1 uroporphyrinogen-III synthase [Staphylococcus warneri]MCJ1795648.1 uroporphyrinogen-III synthase [Staphylococcus warneri]